MKPGRMELAIAVVLMLLVGVAVVASRWWLAPT